jgi:hypothetical protein
MRFAGCAAKRILEQSVCPASKMKEHLFTSQLWVARSPAEIFPFFADAKNLGAITPPWLHFEILTPGQNPERLLVPRVQLENQIQIAEFMPEIA